MELPKKSRTSGNGMKHAPALPASTGWCWARACSPYTRQSAATVPVGRLVGTAVGTALVARAASRRGGVAGVVGKLAGRPTLFARLLSPAGHR